MLGLASIITGCVSISAFPSLVCVPVDFTSFTVGIKICANTAEIKKHKSIIKKKKKKYDKTVWKSMIKHEWKNGIETILDNDGILWLNEKHLEERLDHKNLWETAIKYHLARRKH